ncbi:hypothetical protein ACFOYW_18365 [Gryllotalpicola reticulitermitis]|uniref:TrbL/VirB6 plasmid conjugal transfer protein n=1 Tax=Gryllotalpicola reticulitermitis TaxID=1184153 RepID=A0ABV8QCA1_9MICO
MAWHKNRIQRVLLALFAPIVAFSSIAGLQFFSGSAVTANAASTVEASLSDTDQATSIAYFNDLRQCFQQAESTIKTSTSSPQTAAPSTWFPSGLKMDVLGQSESCSDIATAALKLWGFSADGGDLLEQIGYTYSAKLPGYTDSKGGLAIQKGFTSYMSSEVFGKKLAGNSSFPTAGSYYAYQQTLINSSCSATDLGPVASLNAAQADQIGTTVSGMTYTKTTVVNGDGSTSSDEFSYKSGKSDVYVWGSAQSASGIDDGSTSASTFQASCATLVKDMGSAATAAAADLAQTTCTTALTSSSSTPTSAQVSACAAGLAHKSNITYCATTATYTASSALETACFQGAGYGNGVKCAVKYSDASDLQACLIGSQTNHCSTFTTGTQAAETPSDVLSGEIAACQYGQKIGPGATVAGGNAQGNTCATNPLLANCQQCPDGSTPAAEGSCPTTPSCTISGIGWIVCPVMTFLSSVADSMYGILSSDFLPVSPLSTTIQASSGKSVTSPTYAAWKIMQSFANVVLVIVFLVMIFSQLTDGFGNEQRLASWGVKRLLPRLIIAAIAMNLSFFVCEVLIDLSNIFGVSVKGLFDGVASSVASSAGTTITATVGNGNGWGSVVGTVLDVVAGGAIGYFALTMFGSLLLAAVLVLLMVLFILIARQVLIVLLVVLSPLAFVAFILPNTQKLFKRWWDILFALLLLFPIIGAVYGASELASIVLQYSYSAKFTVGSQTISNPNSSWFGQILASAVMVIPLVAVPFILKGALSAVPMLGQLSQKWANRANSNFGKQLRSSYQNSAIGRGQATRRLARQNLRDQRFAENLQRKGVLGTLTRTAAGGLSPLSLDRRSAAAQKEAILRAATNTAATAQSAEVKAAMELLSREVGTNPGDILTHIQKNHAGMSDVQMEAAVDHLLAHEGTRELRTLMSDQGVMSRHARSVAVSARRNDSVVRRKAPDLANWASTTAAAQGGAFGGSTTASTYEGAQASKLIDLDPASAAAAEPYIQPEEARRALQSQRAIEMKPDTRKILERVAAMQGAQAMDGAPVVDTAGGAPAPSNADVAPGAGAQPVDSFQQPPTDDSAAVDASSLRFDGSWVQTGPVWDDGFWRQGPALAGDVLRQVSDKGGWQALSNEDVTAAWEHARQLPPSVNKDALLQQAMQEVARRNLITPAQAAATSGGVSDPTSPQEILNIDHTASTPATNAPASLMQPAPNTTVERIGSQEVLTTDARRLSTEDRHDIFNPAAPMSAQSDEALRTVVNQMDRTPWGDEAEAELRRRRNSR